jgi:hypothetical protein
MVLKIRIMTPRRPKQLPGDEDTGESRPPSGEYTAKSRLSLVNTPGSLDSPVINTPGSLDFLVYSGTSLRTGKKNIY